MASTELERDRFRYTPGDGYAYRWDGGEWITVSKIRQDGTTWTEELTADVIPAPAVRTGTALIEAVVYWAATVEGRR